MNDHDHAGNKDPFTQRLIRKETGVLIKSKSKVVAEASRLIIGEPRLGRFHFKHVLSFDLEELKLDKFARGRCLSKIGEDCEAFILVPVG